MKAYLFSTATDREILFKESVYSILKGIPEAHWKVFYKDFVEGRRIISEVWMMLDLLARADDMSDKNKDVIHATIIKLIESRRILDLNEYWRSDKLLELKLYDHHEGRDER